jgi:hypothetical protein
MSIRKRELLCRSSLRPVISNGAVNGMATNLDLLTPQNEPLRGAFCADNPQADFRLWRIPEAPLTLSDFR